MILLVKGEPLGGKGLISYNLHTKFVRVFALGQIGKLIGELLTQQYPSLNWSCVLNNDSLYCTRVLYRVEKTS